MAIDMQAMAINRQIDDLMDATQKPFANRLEAACYIYISNNLASVKGQEGAQREARRMARFLQSLIYMDVDRSA